ncbi:MAG: hypothetical protein H6733_15165 [Alphaproteobacteria bacterium]|nr:hypothetical protein [Alphaproteobacteria bacterium]
MSTVDRRSFLGGVAALSSLGLLSGSGVAWAAQPGADASLGELLLRRMLRGVAMGEPFYGDWVLVEAYPPMAGGVVLVVAKGTSGDPIRVDVVRRDDPTRAPAFTEHLELFVMDGGGGVRKMPHDLVEALQALASRLEDNEAQGKLSGFLLTHTERTARYPKFMDRASTDLAPRPPVVIDGVEVDAG